MFIGAEDLPLAAETPRQGAFKTPAVWHLFGWADLAGLGPVGWAGRPRAWCPSWGNVEPGARARESAEGQSQKAVSELAAQAGRWELEAKMGDCA